jgi:hypothetical protein
MAGCLVLACGGKTVGGGPPGGSLGDDSSSSSSGASSGSTSSSGGSSSGGSSSGSSSSGSSSGVTVSCVSIDLSSYDQSCQHASDCISVLSGEVCDGQCNCPEAPVNSSEQGRYDQAISSIDFAMCGCTAEFPPQCVNGLCTSGPGEVDAGEADAGVCVDVDVSTYDTSCKADSDCIDITAGVLCTGQCDCGGSTINVDGQARYEAAVAPVRFEDCPCAFGGPLRCIQNQCTRCAVGSNDPPGCSDDGG